MRPRFRSTWRRVAHSAICLPTKSLRRN